MAGVFHSPCARSTRDSGTRTPTQTNTFPFKTAVKWGGVPLSRAMLWVRKGQEGIWLLRKAALQAQKFRALVLGQGDKELGTHLPTRSARSWARPQLGRGERQTDFT